MVVQVINRINIDEHEFNNIKHILGTENISFAYKIEDNKIIINRRSNGASKFLKTHVISSYKVIRNTDPDVIVLTTDQLEWDLLC